MYFCHIMRYLITISLAAMLLSACSQSEDDKAKPLLARIDSLYNSGNYRATLDSIVRLREHYPQAIEARKAALRIWQRVAKACTGRRGKHRRAAAGNYGGVEDRDQPPAPKPANRKARLAASTLRSYVWCGKNDTLTTETTLK